MSVCAPLVAFALWDAVFAPGLVRAETVSVQLGSKGIRNGSLGLVWQTKPGGPPCKLQFRQSGDWQDSSAPVKTTVDLPPAKPREVWEGQMTGLAPGATVEYRIVVGGFTAFRGSTVAPRATDSPSRFVVVGDCSVNGADQKKISYEAYLHQPDYVLFAGDIVYPRGRVSEYDANFYPVYGAGRTSSATGSKLLSQTLCVAATGNHDTAYVDTGAYPDLMGYFVNWRQPLDGPDLTGLRSASPPLKGPQGNIDKIVAASGGQFPRSLNFSFDYGDAHWAVIDSNTYVDWSDPALRKWLASDLASAQSKTWRFLLLHHTPFHSSEKHKEDKQMRSIFDILHAGKVDVVFAGHVHNYQRTAPIVNKPASGLLTDDAWSIDSKFDGKTVTTTNGIVFVTEGAGGGPLYDREIAKDPKKWKPWTVVYKADWSLGVVDLNGRSMTLRQIDGKGQEIDSFTLTK